MTLSPLAPYDDSLLPAGVRARFVDNGNGLTMHLLEAGEHSPDRASVLLLHGFPELAYSWRRVMPPLARAGFHVIAPDQRGYGRTTGWQADYDGDLSPFRLLNLVRDALGLVAALGLRSVAAVVGHDFGSPVAAYCSLVRPDVFRSVALMSAPFAGPPSLPFNTAGTPATAIPERAAASVAVLALDRALALLDPPRKHYQWYYSSREADADMREAPQGLHAFLRAYYHYKSADWKENRPFRLESAAASEFAKLPAYYVMQRDQGMAETVATQMPSAVAIAACDWLPDSELAVYSAEYQRNGFQGGLQWYRCMTGAPFIPELQLFSGRTIDVPSCFIAGASDWGTYQRPGDFEVMQSRACTRFAGAHRVAGAGHWVQQEQPGEVVRLLLQFLQNNR